MIFINFKQMQSQTPKQKIMGRQKLNFCQVFQVGNQKF
jgi:hypothetical protein